MWRCNGGISNRGTLTMTSGSITNNITNDTEGVAGGGAIYAHDGLFSGNLEVLIDDNTRLEALIKKLRTVRGVKQVNRI